METVVISHSEVDSFLLCKQRHFYAFADGGLEPTKFGHSLYRGQVGHKSLETYYKALQSGSLLEDAKAEAIKAIQQYAIEPDAQFDILADLSTRILPNYYDQVAKDMDRGWRIKAVEKTFRLSIEYNNMQLVYPFTPDLIIEEPSGRNHVVDHKFIYNFYSGDEIQLLPQIPKYIGALRALDKPVRGGIYNMLRWRPVKSLATEDNFRREPFKPSNSRIRQAFTQQVNVMVEIAKLKQKSLEDWQASITRVQNSMVCKSCSFKSLCITEINGEDSTLMKKVNFVPNSYGYKSEEESE